MSADLSQSLSQSPSSTSDYHALFASPIEADNIAAMEPNAWLTNSCIRILIHTYSTPTTSNTTPRINFVDPDWLATWQYSYAPLPTTPSFFSHLGPQRLQGLAIPFNVNNYHWVTLYINLEARGVLLFDSAHSLLAESQAREVCSRFFSVFEEFFWKIGNGVQPRFRFEVDDKCAQQQDGSSCGLYAVRNCLDLLDRRRPSGVALTEDEIANARRNGRVVLRQKWKAQAG